MCPERPIDPVRGRAFSTAFHVPPITALLVLALLAAIPTAAPAEPPTAMTNEDVVRMSVAGDPSSAILEAIRSAPAVAFDLDPEVVTELRRAGVEEIVIEAMREASNKDATPPSVPAESEPGGSLSLAFEDDEKLDLLRNTIVAPARDDEGTSVSLAFYVTCVYPTHVPDLWRKHTALSVEFPRHRLLFLHEETTGITRGGKEMIHLEKPEGHTIPIPAGNHMLAVGIAARSEGEPWVPIAEDSGTVEIGADETIVLRIRLRTRARLRRTPGNPYTIEVLPETAEP